MKPPRLHRKKRDGYYSLVFYDPNTRKRKWVSLGTQSRAQADRIARKLTRAFEDGDYDPFGPKRFEVEKPTLRKTVERYLEEIEVRDVTRKRYAGVLNLLLADTPAGLHIDFVRASDLSGVINRPSSPASKRAYLRTLRAFFRWCVAEGLMPKAPTDEIKPAKLIRTAPKFLSREEYVRLLEVVDDELFRDLIRFAVGSGMRLSEITNLRHGDVDEELGLIYVQTRKDFTTKSGDRTVPLSPLARDAYDSRRHAYPGRRVPNSALIFTSKEGPLSTSYVSHKVKRYLRKAGLDEAYHFHTFRHTFASWLRIDGVGLDRIQEWLGHSSITTTEVYAHLSPENARDEILRSFPA